MIKVYLAGGIQGLSDAECKSWRDDLKKKYTLKQTQFGYMSSHDFEKGHGFVHQIQFLDPLRRDYRAFDKSHTKTADDFDPSIMKKIVEFDKIDIEHADALIINHPKPSTGTDMETLYAWEKGKINVGIVPLGVITSPWFIYHTHQIVTTPDEAVEYLLEYFS